MKKRNFVLNIIFGNTKVYSDRGFNEHGRFTCKHEYKVTMELLQTVWLLSWRIKGKLRGYA